MRKKRGAAKVVEQAWQQVADDNHVRDDGADVLWRWRCRVMVKIEAGTVRYGGEGVRKESVYVWLGRRRGWW